MGVGLVMDQQLVRLFGLHPKNDILFAQQIINYLSIANQLPTHC
jgi:hypothetical protein